MMVRQGAAPSRSRRVRDGAGRRRRACRPLVLGGETAFWLGVLAIVGPTAARLVSAAPTRAERIVLVAGLEVAAYLMKMVIWPVQYTFHDEFVHWRTAADILRTHHLFATNPLTRVSAPTRAARS
jgi:hypothetical protein